VLAPRTLQQVGLHLKLVTPQDVEQAASSLAHAPCVLRELQLSGALGRTETGFRSLSREDRAQCVANLHRLLSPQHFGAQGPALTAGLAGVRKLVLEVGGEGGLKGGWGGGRQGKCFKPQPPCQPCLAWFKSLADRLMLHG